MVKLIGCAVGDSFFSPSLFDGVQTLEFENVSFKQRAGERLLLTFTEYMQAHPESTIRVLVDEGCDLPERDRTELLFLQKDSI